MIGNIWELERRLERRQQAIDEMRQQMREDPHLFWAMVYLEKVWKRRSAVTERRTSRPG